jgi:uncharacterized Tic20 family protein
MPARKSNPLVRHIKRHLSEGVDKVKPVSRKVKSTHDTVLLSALAHGSFAVFFLLGPLTMAVPLAIWFLEHRRPKPVLQVEFHARQAFFYQLAVWAAAGVLIGLSCLFIFIFIGLAVIPFIILAFLAAVAYAVYGAIQVWNGNRFRYKFVTNYIERQRRK